MDFSNIPKLYVVVADSEIFMAYTSREKAEQALQILKSRNEDSDEDSDDSCIVEILEGQAFGGELRMDSECIFFRGGTSVEIKRIKELPDLNHLDM